MSSLDIIALKSVRCLTDKISAGCIDRKIIFDEN